MMFPRVSNHSSDKHITVHAVYIQDYFIICCILFLSKRLVISSLLIGKLYNFTHLVVIFLFLIVKNEGSQSTQEITHIACNVYK